jgi:hypothetical protein
VQGHLRNLADERAIKNRHHSIYGGGPVNQMRETFRNLCRLTPELSDLSVDDMAAQGSLTGADRLFN